MAVLAEQGIRNLADLRRYESDMPLERRLPERSILDVFIGRAAEQPQRIALTMLMTGAPDEQPRRVSYQDLLGLIRRAANLFASLGGARPGVAYMLPSLVETHATLWGAEAAGYAVPINFLLQPEHIAELLKASGARILVALGPHPVLDIWQKALALRDAVPGLTLVRVAPPTTPAEPGVVDFHTALMAQPGDRLTFGEAGRDSDVAAYFHTGGTTGAPKLAAHSHRGQLVAALGGAVLGDMAPPTCSPPHCRCSTWAARSAAASRAFIGRHGVLIMPTTARCATGRCKRTTGGWSRSTAPTSLSAVPTVLAALCSKVPLAGADISPSRARRHLRRRVAAARAVRQRFERLFGLHVHESWA